MDATLWSLSVQAHVGRGRELMCHLKLDAKASDYSQRKDYLSHHATVFQGNRAEAEGRKKQNICHVCQPVNKLVNSQWCLFFPTVCFGTRPLRQVTQTELPRDAKDRLKKKLNSSLNG